MLFKTIHFNTVEVASELNIFTKKTIYINGDHLSVYREITPKQVLSLFR